MLVCCGSRRCQNHCSALPAGLPFARYDGWPLKGRLARAFGGCKCVMCDGTYQEFES